MRLNYIKLTFLLFCPLFVACNSKEARRDNANKTIITNQVSLSPEFNADSAYHFVEKQTLFGPRVPNTQEHILCGDYLVSEMKRFGASVIEQKMDLKAYNGNILHARNIIGSFNKDKQDRILLFAHWDTRPYADHDPDPANHQTPIMGANDGASGVGVLMEIARLAGINNPELGIDIIFFDAEDYGVPEFYTGDVGDDTWCLGSQYWSVNPHVKGYTARFGILLDMVGAKNALFPQEGFSVRYARRFVDKIWLKAREIGYGKYFVNEKGGFITDDHLYVNQLANIPSVDIIQMDKTSPNGFYKNWHTVDDTMEFIDRETLKAVGQTVLEIIYNEK